MLFNSIDYTCIEEFLLKCRRTEIICCIFRETTLSRYFAKINFRESSCWKIKARKS